MIVGILGAGQLGRMLALAGYPLGLQFRFFDPAPESPAEHLAERITARYDDQAALERFVDGLDVVTYEFENVPVETARFLAERCPVYPPPAALEAAQDRIVEKELFRQLGIPTPRFAAVSSDSDLAAAAKQVGLPGVLKTCRLGYDGRGQFVVRDVNELTAAWRQLAGEPSELEQLIPFQRELSLLSVRGHDGQVVFYPLIENHHQGGILRLSLAPADQVAPQVQAAAQEYAARLLQTLDYVGVLAIEFFETEGGLVANEMAPRVHNSGHWSIEGAYCSQFENHLRAIAGFPLGETTLRGPSAMLNLIGTVPPMADIVSVPGAHLHLYGKEPRSGRKLGHVTLEILPHVDFAKEFHRLQALVAGRAMA